MFENILFIYFWRHLKPKSFKINIKNDVYFLVLIISLLKTKV